jgi:hypothetical protein
LQLAKWIASPSNPLTARVAVNRFWHWMMGRGLVDSVDNFGTTGSRPSHPELLDHLASEFISEGWDVKKLVRKIALSRAYQLSSVEPNPSAFTADPENKLLWRAKSRRLQAEEIRDAILAVSGRLDRSRGEGHPFPPSYEWGYSQHGPFGAVYDHDRRSLYLMTGRLKRHPFLALFDGADPNASTADRLGTTVPRSSVSTSV